MSSKTYKYNFNYECVHESGDYRWEGHNLDAHGDNLSELCESASIEVVDQDGESITNYGIEEFPDKVIRMLEDLTGEIYEQTEYYRMQADIAKLKAVEHKAWQAIQENKPCVTCGNLKGSDWYYMGDKCRPCHIESLKTCFVCKKPNNYYNEGGYCISTTCAICTEESNKQPSECGVCYEVKPYGNAYFLKLPDCGPGGHDVEEFCCELCSKDHSRYFNRGKLRGRK